MSDRFRRRPFHANAIVFGLIISGAIWLLLRVLVDWHPYVDWLVAVNIATFVLFGIDKGLSKTDRKRVPETVLHLFTLLGGVIGQLAGRYIFHHKTNYQLHPSFTFILIPSILINGFLLYWLVL